MNKRNFTFILLSLLLNLIFYVDVNTANKDYIPTNVDIERLPKNILFGSYVGGRSHLKPMLDIAAILIERGHDITLLSSGSYTPSSEYPTVRQISMGPPINVRDLIKDPKMIHKNAFSRSALSTLQNFGVKSYKDAFEKYKNAAIDHNIDLFVCYAMLNDACLDVAHALNKPVVGFMAFLNALDQKTYKSDPGLHCNISLENESFLERFRCTIIQPLLILYTMYPHSVELNELRSQLGIENVFLSLHRLSKTSLVLIDNFFGFELPQTLPPNIQEIGPIISNEYPPLAPELTKFINEHERVLYVAFGARFFSTIKNNNKLLQSFVEIINKNIIDGVIWALSETPKDEFSPTLNLTDGSQIQSLSILNNEHPHINILSFAPQFAILNHTNTKLFLTHGGVGSIHESLYTGTPMLVLPFGGDQMGNAQKLQSAGVALSLEGFNMKVDDIVSKVEILLKDENVKKNTKRMKVLANINSKRKYRAADLIEYILYRHDESINDELNEWIPANYRMGFIRGNNYDVFGALLSIILGLSVGILWVTFKSTLFIIKIVSPPSSDQKSKRE